MDNISLTIRRCKRGNESKLVLSSKELTSIPSEIFQLSSLQTLDLSNNKITTVDFKISSLEGLINLDLSKNLIAILPSSILALKNLNNLNLIDNPLNANFETLAKKENQIGFKLQETLKKVFDSLNNEEKPKNNASIFFDDEPSKSGENFVAKSSNTMTQSSLLNQLVNTEKLLKIEEQKVAELTKQLEKLKIGKNSGFSESHSGGFFNSEEKILQSSEIDLNELKMGEVISQGLFNSSFFKEIEFIIFF
jgi:Leucine rich repeat